MERQARHEARRDRTCKHCGDPIPPAAKAGALHCSKWCKKQARLARLVRPCELCKRSYVPSAKKQRWCSVSCAKRAQRKG